MQWFRLYSGKADPGLNTPVGGVVAGLMPPSVQGAQVLNISGLPGEVRGTLLNAQKKFERGCDPLQIGIHASIQSIGAHEAQVVRVRQRINGDVVGGYSLVLMGHP